MKIQIELSPADNSSIFIPRLRKQIERWYGDEIESLTINVDNTLTTCICKIDGSEEHDEVQWLYTAIDSIGAEMNLEKFQEATP